jgi:polyisoprenoid-binding protein YceI
VRIFNLLVGVAIVALTSLFGADYKVEAEGSMVTFKIRHAMVAKVEGKFNEFSGSYSYDANSSTFSSFVGEASTASVNTDDEYRDKHLKEKVFEVEKYPTMKLELVKQDGNSFVTDLTIKKVTKRIDMTISLVAEMKNMFILSGKINRKDFGLTFSDTSKIGDMSVGDEVEINILFGGA